MPHKLQYLAGLLQLVRDRPMPAAEPSAIRVRYAPTAEMLKAIRTDTKTAPQPYMVLANFPPQWHKFDPAVDTGYTGPALFRKSEAAAVVKLTAMMGHAGFHALSHDEQMAKISEHAPLIEAQAASRRDRGPSPLAPARLAPLRSKSNLNAGPRPLQIVSLSLKGRT